MLTSVERTIYENPDPAELRKFTEEMPNCRITEFGNVNVQTRVTSRSAGSTYVVTDDPSAASGKTMPREEYERIAAMQEAYATLSRRRPRPSPACSRRCTSRGPRASPRST